MSINLKPLGNNVIVEPIEDEQKTAFGIILPETAKEKPQKGKVIATGPGKRLESGERQEMVVKVGDDVIYAKYGGTKYKMGSTEILILSEDDILATLA